MQNEIPKEVIWVYPEILLEAFNSCLQEERFFGKWKKQRLAFYGKGEKPSEDGSSFRQICLLDAMEKLMEKIRLYYIIANIKCIYIISSHSSGVFPNNFYRIDINKENELSKIMLQLCRIACSWHRCISFSLRSIDISLDGIDALERS